MKVSKIELKGIKSFDNETVIELPQETPMCAFSGRNGAGKSTILKAIWLCQKAHFVKTRSFEEEIYKFASDIKKYLSGKESYIRVSFRDEDTEASITINKNNNSSQGYDINYENEEYINSQWNTSNPKNLVLYIDASKGFSEKTLTFDEINIKGNDKGNLVIEAILNPEMLFSGIYSQLVRDYVHDRLIPNKPDRLLYYHVASKLFTHLIPNVELKNFSGNHTAGEFVLLGKAGGEKGRPLYDVRDFSSGEKALLSTLTFLCISKTVSTLIIDEPENHFHESLLLEFMSVLHRLCDKGGISEWVKLSDGQGKRLKLDWVEAEYKDHNINQVLVSTHSKSLIYKFFLIGKNYVINNSITAISYEDAESALRKIGLSAIHTKVLLVEGSGDHEALEHSLQEYNVQIKPLNGSSAVIDTFKRVAEIRSYVKDSRFVFLVDDDNKPEEFFEKIKKIDEEYYESNFIRIDRHEFENYFLNVQSIKKTADKFTELTGNFKEELNEENIEEKLLEIAKESLPFTYKKELSLLFQQIIDKKFSSLIWGSKNFKWDTAETIRDQLEDTVLIEKEFLDLKKCLSDESKRVFENYSQISKEDLLKRCDGKIVLSKLTNFYAPKLGISNSSFKRALYKVTFSDKDSEASKLIKQISERLD